MEKGSLILIAVLLIATSCGNGSSNESSSSDQVIIGNQVWMTKNLNVETYRNGDIIPQVQDSTAWANLTTGAWCYYDNDSSNGEKYGKLYNWYAVNDSRGLAPKGWHIPDEEEWFQLTDYLGGESEAGDKMKSRSGWYDDGNGTNSSGFSGLPGGTRTSWGRFFDGKGAWWSSSKGDEHYAWYRYLYSYGDDIQRDAVFKEDGLYVRCVKD